MIREIDPRELTRIADLGAGGMAEVWKAQQVAVGRLVAVKQLRTHLQAEAAHVERFKQEVRALAQAQSDHIVIVYDYGLLDGRHTIIMEYIEGRDLRKEMRAHGRLDVPQALTICAEVADALGDAHKAGIVHRDIKPENVLLTQHGKVKVTDFGIACLLSSPSITMTGMIVGTPVYMAPEQFGTGPVDHRADLYSLGVMLYELLTGRRPFEAQTLWELRDHHISTPPPDPRHLHPDVPEPVSRIIMKALEKSPDARFKSASEFAGALREAVPKPQRRTEPTAALRKPLAFVVMPLTDRFDRVYQLIKEACEQEGCDVERADESILRGDILERIFAHIQKCDFVIADLSTNNLNVLFELGYARAFNKDCLMLTSETIEHVPFSLRQERIVEYARAVNQPKAANHLLTSLRRAIHDLAPQSAEFRAKRALQEMQLEQVFQKLHLPWYIVDANERVVAFNAAFAGRLTVPKEALLGKHFSEVVEFVASKLIDPEFRDVALRDWKTRIEHGKDPFSPMVTSCPPYPYDIGGLRVWTPSNIYKIADPKEPHKTMGYFVIMTPVKPQYEILQGRSGEAKFPAQQLKVTVELKVDPEVRVRPFIPSNVPGQ